MFYNYILIMKTLSENYFFDELFTDYMNPHDNCLWDAIIPGYNEVINKNNKYITKKVIGVLRLSNGNHKIAVRIGRPGYNAIKAKKDIKKYVKKYLKDFYNNYHNVRGEWIQISDF